MPAKIVPYKLTDEYYSIVLFDSENRIVDKIIYSPILPYGKMYINPTLVEISPHLLFRIKHRESYTSHCLDRCSLVPTKERYFAWMKFIEKYVIENIEGEDYFIRGYKVFDMLICNKYYFTDASRNYGKTAFKTYDKKGNLIICAIVGNQHTDIVYDSTTNSLKISKSNDLMCNYEALLFDYGTINVYSSILIAELRRIAGCKYDVDREILRLREYPRAIADELVDIAGASTN